MSTQRWAVILGVSSGTGAATARELARSGGWNIFGVHRGNHPDLAEELERDLAAGGGRHLITRADASTPEAAAALCTQLREIAGPEGVSLLAHALADASMGSFLGSPGEGFHPKQIEKTFRVMAHSFVYWSQALVENDLLAREACMLAFTNPFVDSICAGFGLIAASKAALETYVRHLAFELAPRQVRVNIVKFGLVETPAVRRSFPDAAWKHIVKRVKAASGNPSICTTDEVARLVAFLTRPESIWFNGATIDFTGAQDQSMLHYVLTHK